MKQPTNQKILASLRTDLIDNGATPAAADRAIDSLSKTLVEIAYYRPQASGAPIKKELLALATIAGKLGAALSDLSDGAKQRIEQQLNCGSERRRVAYEAIKQHVGSVQFLFFITSAPIHPRHAPKKDLLKWFLTYKAAHAWREATRRWPALTEKEGLRGKENPTPLYRALNELAGPMSSSTYKRALKWTMSVDKETNRNAPKSKPRKKGK